MNEIIQVTQLPVIAEKLSEIKERIISSTQAALALPVTEENYKEIKNIRTSLRKDYDELETLRKQIKSAVMAPYEELMVTYKECVSDVFLPADKKIAERIASVEDSLKSSKVAEVKEYFEEYAASKGIDFLTFESLNLKITMAASKKSLIKQVTTFLDGVSEDLEMIATLEHSAEILVEYKKTLNASQAIKTVNDRHVAIEAEMKHSEEVQQVAEDKAETVAAVDEVLDESFVAPTVDSVPDDEDDSVPVNAEVKVYGLAFKVDTPKIEHLKAIKVLMESFREEGLVYEQIKR